MPDRFSLCDIFQGSALLQLLLTYITAFLFFDDNGDRAGFEDDSWLGIFLCGANSIGFVVLITVGSLFIYRQSRNTNGLLRYAKGGGVRSSHLHFNLDAKKLQHKKLLARGTPLEFHIFLSHAWANAQDIMRVMKVTQSSSQPVPAGRDACEHDNARRRSSLGLPIRSPSSVIGLAFC
jgi:hypothetical protein